MVLLTLSFFHDVNGYFHGGNGIVFDNKQALAVQTGAAINPYLRWVFRR